MSRKNIKSKDLTREWDPVYSSKIATHVDQIVDVFYVRKLAGNKVTTPERIAEIKQRLLDAIEEY